MRYKLGQMNLFSDIRGWPTAFVIPATRIAAFAIEQKSLQFAMLSQENKSPGTIGVQKIQIGSWRPAYAAVPVALGRLRITIACRKL